MVVEPLAAPNGCDQAKRGELPFAPFGFEKPASRNGDEDSIERKSCEQRGGGDVFKGDRPMGEPDAGGENPFHEQPAEIIEKKNKGRGGEEGRARTERG